MTTHQEPAIGDDGRGPEAVSPIRPIRAALLYALLAAVWIAFGSAAGSLILAHSPAAVPLVEIGMGFGFVAATGVLLYVILERLRRRLQSAQDSLEESRRESEAQRRQIERIARIGHWIWRPDPDGDWAGGCSEYSLSGAAILGVRPAELAITNRQYLERFVHPDDRMRVARHFSDPEQDRSGATLAEYRMVRHDGEVRTVYEATEVVRGNAGEVLYWQGTIQDVTDMRRVEANLAESEARFRDFAEIASHFQWELDENFRIASFAGQHDDIFARSERDIIGQSFQQVAGVQSATMGGDWAPFAKLLLSHEPFDDFAYSVTTGPGEVRYRRASARPKFNSAGTFQGYRGVTRDETKEVEARQRAQAAEELLRRAIESLSDGFAIYDSGDRLVMMNSKFHDSFPGGDSGDPIGKTFEELIRADVALGYYPEVAGREEAFINERLAAHRRSGEVLIYKNSHGRWIQARDQVLPDGSTVAIRTDVTELAERDRALSQSQANLVAAQRIARMGSWEYDLVDLADLDRNPLRWSDETYRIFGQKPDEFEVSNESFYRVVPEADRAMIQDAVRRAVDGIAPYNVEHRALRPDGSEIVIHDMAEVIRDPRTGRPIRMVGTLQDVTQIKRTEEALRQAQKMEAIGQLTGGIAHDFNNLLMVVGGNLELLREGLGPDQQRLQRYADAAHDAVLRGGQLTQRLLAFARRQRLQPAAIDLNRLVGNLVPLMHRTLGEQVTVETMLAGSLWQTLADASQVENALLNLAVNARDAMPAGGKLIIRSENLRLEGGGSADSAELPAGDYVLLSVSDTGQGMPADVRERAFEPFFTTKAAGRGTGLGLSMVYGFVKQSGGHVKILSAPGEGTTVKMFLPRSAEPGTSADASSQAALPRGHERILLVEDEDIVRVTVSAMLEGLGYRVSEAIDGQSALAALDSDPAFDLVLTDMVMPGGMSGWDLAQQVWRRQPGLRFLFSTGYSDSPIFRQAHQDERIQVLPKPYGKTSLALALRRAIDSPIA